MNGPKRKIDRLTEALAAGHLWRAKEILGGRVGSQPYTPELYEQFGLLLLRMGDDLQAGKFLFLSGLRHPEYQAAIDLYIQRFSSAGWQSLLSTFPSAVRRASWSDLPALVRQELVQAGVPPRPDDEPLWGTLDKYPAGQVGWRGCLVGLVVVTGLGLLLSLIVVYFYEV